MRIVFGIVNYAFVLSFGVLLSASFCMPDKVNKYYKSLFIFIVLNMILQIVCWHFLGFRATADIYPLITHFPLFLYFAFFIKKPYPLAMVSILTAYLCCKVPNWIGCLFLFAFKSQTAYYIGNIISIVCIFFVIRRFVAPSVYTLLTHSNKMLYLFGSLPLLFYIFDYLSTLYKDLMSESADVIVGLLPFIVSIFYLLFVVFYHNEMQKRSKLQLDNIMLSMESKQAINELNSMNEIQNQTKIYRHDMRHHLSMINSYLTDNSIENAMSYIKQAQTDIDSITPNIFCDNTTVNLILSSFYAKTCTNNVLFSTDVMLPKDLSISETELCSLLYNGLENAVNAASSIQEIEKRKVHIICKIRKGKLLILIENTFTGNIAIKDGLPISNISGHGFGTKSIKTIADKYNGYCSFEHTDDTFVLRVVI